MTLSHTKTKHKPEKFAVFGYGQPPIVIYHVVTMLSAGSYFLIMMGKLEEIT